jgi:hypothetical protein
MIKIIETQATYSASKLKKIRKAGDGDFGDFLSAAEEAEQTSGSGGILSAMEVGSLNPLLSLQEVSEDDVRRQRTLQQGKQSIDVLEELRREILTGNTNPAMLGRMQAQVEQMRKNTAPDAKLQEIMNDIELRLAVEVAKLEKINFSA